MESTFWSYIVQNRNQILTWLILGVGIVLSILHSKANFKKSILAIIAFLIFLLESIGTVLLSVWTPDFDSMVQLGLFYEAYSWITTVFWIIAWAALYFALFGQESDPSKAA